MKGLDSIVDLSNPRERMALINNIRAREGLHKIEIKRHRDLRSGQQNRYLFGVVYAAFVDFRQEQGEDFTVKEAHQFFSLKFLRRPVVDLRTGEVLGQTRRSTASLDTAEFSEYLELIIAWLSDYGIEVPMPESRQMTGVS